MPSDVAIPHAPTVEYVMHRFHADVVDQVAAAVESHDVVVVGMAWNPHVPKARRLLDQAEIRHHDIDIGNYLAKWKPRLAVKLWAKWPTFPMVFVKGTLIGGASDTARSLKDGSLKAILSGEQPQATPAEAEG